MSSSEGLRTAGSFVAEAMVLKRRVSDIQGESGPSTAAHRQSGAAARVDGRWREHEHARVTGSDTGERRRAGDGVRAGGWAGGEGWLCW